jgi:hypothetical protein
MTKDQLTYWIDMVKTQQFKDRLFIDFHATIFDTTSNDL